MQEVSRQGGAQPQNEQVIAHFRKITAEKEQLRSKVMELQQDLREHQLVLATLEPLEKERRAWRKVGGMLLERDVGQCREAVSSNLASIEKLMDELSRQWEIKDNECDEFQRQYQLSVNGMPPPPPRKAEGEQKRGD